MITAIILNYYKERVDNLPIIIEALRSSTTPPDKIVVFDNSNTFQLQAAHDRFSYVEFVHYGTNVGCFGRYLAAWSVPHGYVFFQDNDLVVGETLIERLHTPFQHATTAITGIVGRHINQRRNPYFSSSIAPGNCDIIVGRASMMRTTTAQSVILYAFDIQKTSSMFRCDDIIASSMFNRSRKLAIHAVDGYDYTSIPENGIGLSFDSNHYIDRDRLVSALISKGAFPEVSND